MDPKQKIALIVALIIFVLIVLVFFYYSYYIRNSVPSTPTRTPPLTPTPLTPTPLTPTPLTPTPLTPVPVSGKYMGCYKDNATRILPTGAGIKTWANCQSMAKAANAPYFGMQYANGSPAGQAYCFYGGSDYTKLGSADTCTMKDPQGHILGASWTNAVYST